MVRTVDSNYYQRQRDIDMYLLLDTCLLYKKTCLSLKVQFFSTAVHPFFRSY